MRRNFNTNVGTRMKSSKIILIVPIIFVIIGLTLVFFAFKQKNDNDNFMKTAVPISAECTRVWVTSSTDDDGDTTYYYHADVEYEYDGIKYYKNDISVDDDTRKGDTVNVYINPSHPTDVRQEYTKVEFIYQLIMGGIIAVVGLVSATAILVSFRNTKPKVNEPWEIR